MNLPQEVQGTLSGSAPGTSGYNPAWFAFTDVFWDPAGGVGGSDANSGNVIGSPVLTWAEIQRRYGAAAVIFIAAQNLLVHQLSSQVANVDPVQLDAMVANGSQIVLLGTPIANGGTFSPATVTAKNKATPTNLVLNTVPGGVVGKNLIQNTTSALKGWAFVDVVGGGNATVSQPVANSSITTVGMPTLTEDTAWVNTDTYQAFTLPLCNLKLWRAHGGDASAGGVAGGAWVQFVEIVDSSGSGASEFPLVADAAVTVFSACRFDTRVHASVFGGRGSSAYLIGCDVAGQLVLESGGMQVFGGVLRSGLSQTGGQLSLDGDAILHSSVNFNGGGLLNIGSVFGDGTMLVQGGAVAKCNQVTAGGATTLWGSIAVTVDPSSAYWNASGTTWALTLLTSGALKLGANTTGSFFTPGTGLWTSAINITAANLDTNNGLQNPQTGARFCNTS